MSEFKEEDWTAKGAEENGRYSYVASWATKSGREVPTGIVIYSDGDVLLEGVFHRDDLRALATLAERIREHHAKEAKP